MQMLERELTIKAPWGTIAGLSWGEPKNPPVILCHGKLDTCSSFRPLVSRLPSCFYYISIDLPGNGRSDHLPTAVRYSVMDLVPTIVNVVKHFNLEKFVFIGHSLGVAVGKFFNIAYPGQIIRMVELDPVPAYHTWPCTREGIKTWYHFYYQMYNDDQYQKIKGDNRTAPKYTFDKAQQLMMKSRRISKEASEHVLERCLVPAGDGLYSFTFDQRLKAVTQLPFSGEAMQKLYVTTDTPTFCVLVRKAINLRYYDDVPFLMDEKAWPNKNYKFKIVKGGHDVHLVDRDGIAKDISQFLLEEFKAKL